MVLAEIDAHVDTFGPGPHQLVKSTAYGGFVHRNGFGEMWRRAYDGPVLAGSPQRPQLVMTSCTAQTAALTPAHMVPRGTRFDDLRHFYPSALIAANLKPKVIQARLGQATVAETMGHLRAPVPGCRRPRDPGR